MRGQIDGGFDAMRAGEPLDVSAGDLPAWARVGEACHWWRRATVTASGEVSFYDDDGSIWLAENGLDYASQASVDTVDAVLHARAGVDPPLADEHRLVDPRVALVAGLQTRRRAEVLVLVGCLRALGERRLDALVHLDHALVREVEDRVVRRSRRAHTGVDGGA
jgi:hypothetical protein